MSGKKKTLGHVQTYVLFHPLNREKKNENRGILAYFCRVPQNIDFTLVHKSISAIPTIPFFLWKTSRTNVPLIEGEGQ